MVKRYTARVDSPGTIIQGPGWGYICGDVYGDDSMVFYPGWAEGAIKGYPPGWFYEQGLVGWERKQKIKGTHTYPSNGQRFETKRSK